MSEINANDKSDFDERTETPTLAEEPVETGAGASAAAAADLALTDEEDGKDALPPLPESAHGVVLEKIQRLTSLNEPTKLDNLGRSPLHYACFFGHLELVKWLLQQGVDIDLKDDGQYTPLLLAIHGMTDKGHDCEAVVEHLVRAGCNVNAMDEEFMTALDTALQAQESAIIRHLLLGGCHLQKSLGHVYYRDHVANSVAVSLLEAGDADNACLLILGGHVSPAQLRQVAQCYPMDPRRLAPPLGKLMFQPLSLFDSCRVVVRRYVMKLSERCPDAPPFLTSLRSFCRGLPGLTQLAVMGLGHWREDDGAKEQCVGPVSQEPHSLTS